MILFAFGKEGNFKAGTKFLLRNHFVKHIIIAFEKEGIPKLLVFLKNHFVIKPYN
jgi:hypothetical protein